jgi:hypothetical protein
MLFLFVCVYLVNFDALRLTRDDWASIDAMARTLRAHGLAFTVTTIATNEWLGLALPRIFFGSWMIQLLVGYLGRFNYVPYYLFILTAHFGVSCLIFRIFRRLLASPWLAAMLASAFLVLPSATKELFWLNDWFFAIPFDLLVLQVYFLVFPRKSPYAQTGVLFLLTAFGQLCGEQTILMFYWSLSLALFYALRFTRGATRKAMAISCATAALGALAVMLGYVTRVMKFSALHTPIAFSLGRTHDYLVSYAFLFKSALKPTSYVFGSLTVPISAKSGVLMAACVLAIAVVFWKAGSSALWTAKPRALAYTSLALLGYGALAVAPLLYGSYTGARPGPVTSYLFCAAVPFTFLAVCLVVLIGDYLSPRWKTLVQIALPALVAYFACLTIYSANQVWGFQKMVDDGIWRRIDQAMTDRVSFIVTDNLSQNQAQLMAHWDSDAVSDFQADWGIFGRLSAIYGRPFLVGKSVERMKRNDRLRLFDYYGGSALVPKDGGLYLAYRYGPTFYSLKDAQLYVFTSLEDFEAFRRLTHRQ